MLLLLLLVVVVVMVVVVGVLVVLVGGVSSEMRGGRRPALHGARGEHGLHGRAALVVLHVQGPVCRVEGGHAVGRRGIWETR